MPRDTSIATLSYLLLLDMTRNHFHRKVLPAKRATIIKPCQRHHFPYIFNFDRTRRENVPFQKGDSFLVKANRVKNLRKHTIELQSSNTAKDLSRRYRGRLTAASQDMRHFSPSVEQRGHPIHTSSSSILLAVVQ